jgi:hypothetical protein
LRLIACRLSRSNTESGNWGRPNSRVMKGHFAHRGFRAVGHASCCKSCKFFDKNVFPSFSRVFGVAKVCRKISELCDVFCDE